MLSGRHNRLKVARSRLYGGYAPLALLFQMRTGTYVSTCAIYITGDLANRDGFCPTVLRCNGIWSWLNNPGPDVHSPRTTAISQVRGGLYIKPPRKKSCKLVVSPTKHSETTLLLSPLARKSFAKEESRLSDLLGNGSVGSVQSKQD